MKKKTSLLNGDLVTVDLTGPATLAPAVRSSILMREERELEVNCGSGEAVGFYLDSTRTDLGTEMALRSGHLVRTGFLGGDRSGGRAFVVEVGDEFLFGSAPPALSLESLVSWLSGAGVADGPRGPVMRPTGPVGWSKSRTHSAFQSVASGTEDEYLLDVRRIAVPGARRPDKGVKVRGGLLSRSADDTASPHVVLQAADFVAYGIPGLAARLDAVVESMAQLTVELA